MQGRSRNRSTTPFAARRSAARRRQGGLGAAGGPAVRPPEPGLARGAGAGSAPHAHGVGSRSSWSPPAPSRWAGATWACRPAPLPLEQKQAAAAVGQIRLAHAYKELLEDDSITVAQVLLTLQDSEQRRRYLNARATLNTLLELGAIPVINENDTVATSEIRYGDNDRLAARVAQMASADCLVLLSDVDGLYSADPNLDPDARVLSARSPRSRRASRPWPAARRRTWVPVAWPPRSPPRASPSRAGCHMCIAAGQPRHPLRRVETGARCTWFIPAATPVAARKQWIAGSLKPAGLIQHRCGCRRALRRGRSLLPAGVTGATGRFERGDAVDVTGRGRRGAGARPVRLFQRRCAAHHGAAQQRDRAAGGLPRSRRDHSSR